MEDKGEIILATSFGHIIGYDPRVGSEVYRLNHLLKHGFITSMCGYVFRFLLGQKYITF